MKPFRLVALIIDSIKDRLWTSIRNFSFRGPKLPNRQIIRLGNQLDSFRLSFNPPRVRNILTMNKKKVSFRPSLVNNSILIATNATVLRAT